MIRKTLAPCSPLTPSFRVAKASGNVRLWIMEMDAVPNDLGFYCPMTTPFGLFTAPSWLADGRVNKNFKFFRCGLMDAMKTSLPSRNCLTSSESENPAASFSGFGHEGTGVKNPRLGTFRRTTRATTGHRITSRAWQSLRYLF